MILEDVGELIEQVVQQLGPMVGAEGSSLSEAADSFERYAASAPSAMHERIAAVIAGECRDASESAQVRRAFLQGFRL